MINDILEVKSSALRSWGIRAVSIGSVPSLGLNSYVARNGETPINSNYREFMENSARGNHSTQSSYRNDIYARRCCSRVAFSLSVCLSISGWYAVDSLVLVF